MENALTQPAAGILAQQGFAGISTDADAVAAFVSKLKLNAKATERAYLKELRRLLVWMQHAGYPAGSLAKIGTQDLERYFAFLRSHEGLPKTDGGWWKMARPLSPSSLNQARLRLNVFFKKLTGYEVAPGIQFRVTNPLDNIGQVAPTRREKRKPGERIAVAGEERLERSLSIEDIEFVMETIEHMPQASKRQQQHYHRCRWLFRLAYFSWMRISEIARLQMGDFEYRDGIWQIYIWPSKHDKKGRFIEAGDRLMEALAVYRKSFGKPAFPFGRETWPAVMAVIDKKLQIAGTSIPMLDRFGNLTGAHRVEPGSTTPVPMTERSLYAVIKQIFLNAAMATKNRDQAKRLEQSSPHWLRHSGITHALNAGLDPRYVSLRARHKQLLTTLNTYDKGLEIEERKRIAAML